MSRVAVLLDGNRGIYIPRDFATDFTIGLMGWDKVDPSDVEICKAGPDHDLYWEAWDSILRDAVYRPKFAVNFDGVLYPLGSEFRLEQDGDLFMVDDREDGS